MAATLTGAADARLDFGVGVLNTAIYSGLTVVFTITISTLADHRFVSKWGGIDTSQSFIITSSGNQIFWAVLARLAPNYHAYITTDSPLATGTPLRIVCRIDTNAVTASCWVNGVSRAKTVSFGAGSAGDTVRVQSNTAMQVGRETDEAADGVDGDYSEVAIWGESVPDWVAIAYGQGFSPSVYRQNAVFYCPVWNTSSLIDRWGGHSGTNASGTDAAHPAIIYAGAGSCA